jgi:hypothetical protein
MPYSTRSASFGPEFEQLLITAHDGCMKSRSFLLPLESTSHAYSMKMRVYAYFKALRLEADRPVLVEMSEKLCLRVEGQALRFGLREDAWGVTAIRKALGLPDGFSELSAPLEKLRKLRSKK